jgi:hypothetical protein
LHQQKPLLGQSATIQCKCKMIFLGCDCSVLILTLFIIPFQPRSSNPVTRNFEPTIASNPTLKYVQRVLDWIEFFLIPHQLNFPFYSISYYGNDSIHHTTSLVPTEV